eukprot:1137822-Pelagomonas_calceolata.AAC.1
MQACSCVLNQVIPNPELNSELFKEPCKKAACLPCCATIILKPRLAAATRLCSFHLSSNFFYRGKRGGFDWPHSMVVELVTTGLASKNNLEALMRGQLSLCDNCISKSENNELNTV